MTCWDREFYLIIQFAYLFLHVGIRLSVCYFQKTYIKNRKDQKNVRQSQLERAEKMINSKSVKKQRKNPNDPARFVKVTQVTNDGEIAETLSMIV